MVLWTRVAFHRCEDLAKLVGQQNLKEAVCIQKLSRPGGGVCEAVLEYSSTGTVQYQ